MCFLFTQLLLGNGSAGRSMYRPYVCGVRLAGVRSMERISFIFGGQKCVHYIYMCVCVCVCVCSVNLSIPAPKI
jgi:hypothetical protein